MNKSFPFPCDTIVEVVDPLIVGPNDDIILELSGDNERDLAFTSVTMVDDNMHFCRFQSGDYKLAKANCPEGYIIGQGNSKYYVLLKI